MAGSRLYFHNVNTISHPASIDTANKSVALPIGVDKGIHNQVLEMTTTKGVSEVSDVFTTGTSAVQTSGSIRKWVSPVLAAGTISAQNWTINMSVMESNAAANYFLCFSLYVLKADGTVRGYIYDSSTALGTEFPTGSTARVATVAGAAVTGVLSTDQLVCEVWGQGIQTLTTTRTITFKWDGTTVNTDGTSTFDNASYIEAATQDIFAAASSILKVSGVARASISKVDSVALAAVGKVAGVV
jgi:hypothetical protein